MIFCMDWAQGFQCFTTKLPHFDIVNHTPMEVGQGAET